MRIGVLTYHNSINNGAVVQCYSLTKRLMKEFPSATVEVIDYRMPKIEDFYTLSYPKLLLSKRVLRNLIRVKNNPQIVAQSRIRNKVFKDVLNFLPLSPDTIVDDGVDKLFNYINERYDIIIAGSDAIWNFDLRGYPNPYYLGEDVCAIKFSYAASCYGMSYEKLPDYQQKEICSILNSYAFIGVRDEESKLFAEGIGCKTPIIHTCDPTVFLDINDLPVNKDKIFDLIEQRGGNLKRPFIGVMGDNKMCKMVKSLFRKDYQIVSLFNFCKDADLNLYDLNPYEWAYIFRLFKLTFTTYFHGTLLSLRNCTPVICIALENPYSEKHTSKVEDFLNRIGMSDCYFHTDYKSQNINAIMEKAGNLLRGNYEALIKEKMDLESQTAIPFFDKIKLLVES